MFTKTLFGSGIGAVLLILAVSSPVLAKSSVSTAATSTPATAAEIACVGKVVATREAAFDSGSTSYENAVSAAYSARAKSLASAYATGTQAGVASGIKAAWAAFDASTKAASATWSTKRLAAWASFKTAAAACKAPAGVLDSAA